MNDLLLTPQEVLQALLEGKKVQYRYLDDKIWRPFNGDNHINMLLDMGEFEFRLAQEIITIGGVSFPKPYFGGFKFEQLYYFVNFAEASLVETCIWEGSEADKLARASGLVHTKRDNAIAHAKALITLSGGIC